MWQTAFLRVIIKQAFDCNNTLVRSVKMEKGIPANHLIFNDMQKILRWIAAEILAVSKVVE